MLLSSAQKTTPCSVHIAARMVQSFKETLAVAHGLRYVADQDVQSQSAAKNDPAGRPYVRQTDRERSLQDSRQQHTDILASGSGEWWRADSLSFRKCRTEYTGMYACKVS